MTELDNPITLRKKLVSRWRMLVEASSAGAMR
jgi:hypothetical protein